RHDRVAAVERRAVAERRPRVDGVRPRRRTRDRYLDDRVSLPQQSGLTEVAVRVGATANGRAPMHRDVDGDRREPQRGEQAGARSSGGRGHQAVAVTNAADCTIAAMAHSNPSDEELRSLLTAATTIAMVGASSNPDKTSHGIMQR